MPQEISEKEFAVIREISNNHLPDQRTIANKTGLSLGLTNLIIKKLIKTGYIKVKQLNRKKIQYILTPKGFAEKARKSYNYTLKTIKLFKSIKSKIQEIIADYQKQGIRKFIIVGNSELTDIVEIAFNTFSEIKKSDYLVIREISGIDKLKKENGAIIFYTETEESAKKIKNKLQNNFVYLLDYLSRSGLFL